MAAVPKKRMGIDPANILPDGPRLKRRKESTPAEAAKSQEPVSQLVKQEVIELSDEEKRQIAVEGLKVWQAVRDCADSTSGRVLSYDFLRLPNKRQYPDYYLIIKRPLCLEEVKSRLDSLSYQSLGDIKQDFFTIFRNAKRYNLKGSQIFEAARVLEKLVKKQFKALNQHSQSEEADDEDGDANEDSRELEGDDADDMEVDVEAGEPETGKEGVNRKKKDKAAGAVGSKERLPSLQRSLRARLQRLMKINDKGRPLCTDFMELPDKDEWPDYYTIIEHPQCLETIFKKIENKSYATLSEFIADVDLIFDNALVFNEDTSQIANDARTLKKSFHDSLRDMPTVFMTDPSVGPFAGSPLFTQERPKAEQSSTKIKIRFNTGEVPSADSRTEHVKVRLPAKPSTTQSTPVAAASSAVPVAAHALKPEGHSNQASATLSTGPKAAMRSSTAAAVTGPSRHQTLPAGQFYPKSNQAYETPRTQTSASVAPGLGSQSPFSSVAASDYLPSPAPIPAVPLILNIPPPEKPSRPALKRIQVNMLPAGRRMTLQDDFAKAFSLMLSVGETAMHMSVTMNEEDESEGDKDENAMDLDEESSRDASSPLSVIKYDCQFKLVKPSGETLTAPESSNQGLNWVVEPSEGLNVVEINAIPQDGEAKSQIWRIFVNKI